MTRTRTTKFRSYSTISDAVDKCRSLANLGNSTEFNVTKFIVGPLIDHFRGKLTIVLLEDNEIILPAEVEISNDKRNIVLRARRSSWKSASKGCAECRYILAHEIGHIWLHRDDIFGYSESVGSEHKFIPTEEIVEDQAHRFAEIFLLPDEFVSGFEILSELIDYCEMLCGVPEIAISNRFAVIQDKKRHHYRPRYEPGRLCNQCGSERVFAILSYQKCDECGKISY